MSQDNGHAGAADVGDKAAVHAPNTSVGVGIGIGAGLGIVAGLLFGDMVLGMIYGAGIGTVAGVVLEAVRRRRVN